MLQIERIEDPELLKQVAHLLQKENDRLHERIAQLVRELAEARGGDPQGALALEIEKLQAELDRLRGKVFGDSSEKRPKQAPAPEPPRPPAKGHGPREQPKLPVIEKPHELAPAERKCTLCEGELGEWKGQIEETEEITVVERHFVLVKHQRKKYRCRCGGPVVTAPAPPRLIPGGRYSVEFAVEVAAGKYLDHLPLDRQQRIMEREGLEVTTATLWDQIEVLAQRLTPAYDALGKLVLSGPFVHADETHWKYLKQPKSDKERRRWWAWCLATDDVVFHRILSSRATEAGAKMLGEYHGTVLTDGYAVYDALSRAGPFRLANCWAHVRREYVKIEKNYPKKCAEVLDLIGKLYAIEQQVPVSASDEALALRRGLRERESKPVVDAIRTWAYEQRATPGSDLRKAIDYMLGLWAGLTVFLADPRVPLDNNHIERSLRGIVLGRKNHYGSRSKRGTEVAALFYSLVETAKLHGLDPKAYLLAAARRAVAEPGAAPLLPRDLAH